MVEINNLVSEALDTWILPKLKKKKIRVLNPKTNRMKKRKRTDYFTTKVPPEERTLNNRPRYANKKPIVDFKDWLQMNPIIRSSTGVPRAGKGADGKWYGWSHRAIASFSIGDKMTSKVSGFSDLKEPYIIKTDDQAKEAAIKFAKSVG